MPASNFFDVLEAKLCTEAKLYLGVLLIQSLLSASSLVKLADIVWEHGA
jgi:hypothetical protein